MFGVQWQLETFNPKEEYVEQMKVNPWGTPPVSGFVEENSSPSLIDKECTDKRKESTKNPNLIKHI